MALAVIRTQDSERARHRFLIDIGKNRYYSYTIGEKAITLPNGLRVLDEPSYSSPLAGPLAEENLGRSLLEVPAHRFSRTDRYIQLMSYRTNQREGPALSNVLPVLSRVSDGPGLPEIALQFSLENGSIPEFYSGMEVHVNRSNTPNVPFRYYEPVWSQPMFLQGLISALPNLVSSVMPALGNILPAVGKLVPAIGNLLGSKAPAAAAPTAPATSPVSPGSAAPAQGGNSTLIEQLIQAISNPDTLRAVTDIIKSFPSGPSTAKSLGLPAAYQTDGDKYASAAEYSRALIAPALLAALPALMPAIKQLLSPETLKALNPALQGSEINLKQQQQLLEHLRQITPQVGTPEMDKLFEGLSLGYAYGFPASKRIYGMSTKVNSNGNSRIGFQPVESVELRFAEQTALTLDGRQRLLYRGDQALTFPLSLNTPKPIGGAELTLQIKNPESLNVLIEQKLLINKAITGRLLEVPRLEASQVQSLTPNEDYLVCALLVWRSKSGKRLGVRRSHLITIIGEYAFDRVETTEEVVPLNDVEKFREFWHKVWQDSFTEGIRRRFFDVKYYYTLERERTSNARMETISESDKGNGPRDESGRLKAGLITSPFALNELLPIVSGHPALDQSELRALLASDFSTHFRYAARSKVRFRGKNGDSAALWIFPEFRLNKVILQQPVKTDDKGHVLELAEHEVFFPMPAVAHFVGVRTQ